MFRGLDCTFYPDAVVVLAVIAEHDNFFGEETGFVGRVEGDGDFSFGAGLNGALGNYVADAATAGVDFVDGNGRFAGVFENEGVRYFAVRFPDGAKIVNFLVKHYGGGWCLSG